MTSADTCLGGFDPAFDPRAFRRALGRFATGVTIVTAPGETEPVGITANSFASLSLTPPLVMWSPAKASRRHDVFVESRHFAIHILTAEQASLCESFVRGGQSFDLIDHRLNADGVPLLAGCVAVFECALTATHDAGDHTIIIGKVVRAWDSEGLGLLFVNGQFSPLAAIAPAASS
ncbi:MAG: flavin reductase family protein [Hyphomonas sp.]|uniref:flavin reductase family protein n=1 Tax=Hyphomonas sp. TaxID=87 RepID=UPI00349FEE42